MTTMMRAVLIKDERGPAENLFLGEVPKPIPDAGQVLVKESYSYQRSFNSAFFKVDQ